MDRTILLNILLRNVKIEWRLLLNVKRRSVHRKSVQRKRVQIFCVADIAFKEILFTIRDLKKKIVCLRSILLNARIGIKI